MQLRFCFCDLLPVSSLDCNKKAGTTYHWHHCRCLPCTSSSVSMQRLRNNEYVHSLEWLISSLFFFLVPAELIKGKILAWWAWTIRTKISAKDTEKLVPWVLPPLPHTSITLNWIVLDIYHLFLPSHVNSSARLIGPCDYKQLCCFRQSDYNIRYWLGNRITLLLITVITATNIYIILYNFLSAPDVHYLV